jgi:hypothetical protein
LVGGVIGPVGVLAGTGTAFPAALAGAVTPAGAVRFDVGARLTGLTGGVGTVAGTVGRTVGGTLTSAGAVTAAIVARLAGAITPTGAVVTGIYISTANSVVRVVGLSRVATRPVGFTVSEAGRYVWRVVGRWRINDG